MVIDCLSFSHGICSFYMWCDAYVCVSPDYWFKRYHKYLHYVYRRNWKKENEHYASEKKEEQEVERVRTKAHRTEAVESYKALLVETIKDPQVLYTMLVFFFF